MDTELKVTQTMPDEAACWQAVLERDAAFDGAFVYGVRSTGIYCKPSCASRQPRPAQVRFFGGPAEAEAAGFRACKRCRPQEALAPGERAALVEQARTLIETEGGLALAELGRRLHASPTHLQRLFKAAVGLSPRQYAAARRLEQLKHGLRGGQTVTQALYEAGYGSPSRLYERSSVGLGMTPAAYRQGGKAMEIAYTIVDCPLGRMLVAATPRGVCAVSFGEEDAKLEAGLRAEFPAAKISSGMPGDPAAKIEEQRLTPQGRYAESLRHRDDETLEESSQAGAMAQRAAEALRAAVSGARARPELPLDVQGTEFQLRVWAELRRIPLGQTRTYAQVAQALGQPRAVRAVANACGANPTAVVTPCHRVVRSDGGLGGYRWGVERKKILLENEQD